MKINDLTLTLFKWEGIPKQLTKWHTGPTGSTSRLALVTVSTDEGIEGHAFLGTSGRSAELDAKSLIHYLKPAVMGQNPLDRERLHEAMTFLHRNTTPRGHRRGRRYALGHRRQDRRSADTPVAWFISGQDSRLC